MFALGRHVDMIFCGFCLILFLIFLSLSLSLSRDFRHEKTKKKRGSYRGGQIDLQAHSVKFNYSDED